MTGNVRHCNWSRTVDLNQFSDHSTDYCLQRSKEDGRGAWRMIFRARATIDADEQAWLLAAWR
jgi:hypothetical protein